MKNIIIVFLLFSSCQLMAQSSGQTHSEISWDFEFDGTDKTEEMGIDIAGGIEMIGFRLQGEIEQGNLTITIIDPNGKKEGGFQLISSKKDDKKSSSSQSQSSSNEGVHTYTYTTTGGGKAHGSMSKQLDNPISGNWKIMIKGVKVKGKLGIIVGQQGK